jgi:alkanesulfonate monooxygenase SsuD/methylene tetrahydromethanopterin reductase-like flavin-dependent oxidoreductase (luciferase family)
MRDRIRAAAARAGRDPDAIRCIYNIQVLIGGGTDTDPDTVVGSSDEIASLLINLVNHGFSGFNFIADGPDAAAQRAQLGRDVISAVRDATG